MHGRAKVRPCSKPLYRYFVILTSRCGLGVGEVVKRHQAKAGHENAFKGSLREMDLNLKADSQTALFATHDQDLVSCLPLVYPLDSGRLLLQ